MTTEQIYFALLQLDAGDMPLAFCMRPIEDARSLTDLYKRITDSLGDMLASADTSEVQAMIEKLGVSFD